MNREKFLRSYPKAFFLDDDPKGVEAYLKAKSWIGTHDHILSLSKAGEGNMNYAVRVNLEGRTLILKQGRPWVEKYPQIPAPWGRTAVEARFYELISSNRRLREKMPQILGSDPESQTLLLEDLGAASDFTDLYSGGTMTYENFLDLVDFLSVLHGSQPQDAERISNTEMRRLNHEYIFHLPLLSASGPDLDQITPGLKNRAEELRSDFDFRNEVRRLGEIYLAEGRTLVHGDYYPGSWLRTSSGIRIIDPEFCFFGPAEFDVGVFLAHLRFTGLHQRFEKAFFEWYGAPNGFRPRLAFQFAGVEIMRRLIGVAQLPLMLNLAAKADLLSLAQSWVQPT